MSFLQYTATCLKLIGQFKMTEKSLISDKTISSTECVPLPTLACFCSPN